jgi:hypothetical protein
LNMIPLTMTKTTKSPREINVFVGVANAWVRENPENNKLKYAISRVMKSAGRVLSNYQDECEDLNIEYCHTAADGVIEMDSRGQYKFDKTGLRARNKARAALFDKPVEIEVYFSPEVPENLPDETREVFTGFVIEPAPAEA